MMELSTTPPLVDIPAAALPVLITDLEKLLFNDFVKCAVDRDYSALLISGDANPDQLYHAWLQLYSDYCALSGSKEALKTAKGTAKIEILNTKIFQVTGIIEAIRSIPANMLELFNYQRLTALLKDWGYNKPFTLQSLKMDLKRVETELSNDRLKLIRLKKDQEDKDKRKGDSGAATKESYVRAHHAIESYKKMLIPRATLTAYDFAIYLKELQEYNQQIQSQNNKNTKNHGRR